MRIIPWTLLLVIIIGISCQRHDDKIKKSDIIPIVDLVPILVEMHLADGLQQLSSVRIEYPGRDSISNYLDILENFGYSKKLFDHTIEYYENEPDELKDLYEEVISDLTKLQSEIHQGSRNSISDDMMPDLWNQKTVWHLPNDGRINRIGFSIPVKESGKYILTATIRMYQDDGSVEPRITVFFWFDDGTDEGYKIPFESKPIEKNGRIKVYTLSRNLDDRKVTHISGYLLDHTDKSGHWEKHADVVDVQLQHIRRRGPVESEGVK